MLVRWSRGLCLRILLVVILAGGLAASLSRPAVEAAVWPWDLSKLTLRADLIVRGQVTEQASAWDEDKTTIFTDSILEVHDAIKGAPQADELVMRTPGGVVDEVGLTVWPAPRFSEGEEVLVFLEGSPAAGYRVTGSVQGKYSVQRGWALNHHAPDRAVPLVTLVRQILDVMETHGIPASLSGDWETRFPPATERASDFTHPLDFVYDGHHWPGPNPMGEDYLVNTNTSDVSSAEALAAIQAAGETWTNVSGAGFTFSYGGSSTATDVSGNDLNEIMWKDQGNTGTLATTWTWWWTSSKEIFEADMVINDFYNWDTSGSPSGSEFDLESVVLHEFGHYLELLHDDNPGSVMFATISAGTVARTLHQNDIDGIRHIYPGVCLSDFDGDGTVTISDVSEVTERWRLSAEDPSPSNSPASVTYDDEHDLNDDLVIDVIDVSIATGELGLDCE